jgi:cellulose synthase/poly-beta-1,6-N-acetylglucosamine synthase-like glycosyltransferase
MHTLEKTGTAPFVSFIVPARDEGKVIARCLEAIKALDYDERLTEMIVIDDNSVDDTVEVARSFGAKVFTAAHVTISALRNLGVGRARGEFVAFVDADCVLKSDWLGKALEHFKDSKTACVGSYPDIPEDSSWVPKTWDVHQRLHSVQEVDWLPSRTLLVRRDAFQAVGGFADSLVTCEDVDLCYRLRKKGYKIISDERIKSVHLGEPKTLWDFFRKEQWRGRSNFHGMFVHGLYLKEIPSLLVPVYYSIALLCVPITVAYGFAHGDAMFLFINLGILFVPPAIVSLRTCIRVGDHASFARLTLLYFAYSLARSTGIIVGRDYP